MTTTTQNLRSEIERLHALYKECSDKAEICKGMDAAFADRVWEPYRRQVFTMSDIIRALLTEIERHIEEKNQITQTLAFEVARHLKLVKEYRALLDLNEKLAVALEKAKATMISPEGKMYGGVYHAYQATEEALSAHQDAMVGGE